MKIKNPGRGFSVDTLKTLSVEHFREGRFEVHLRVVVFVNKGKPGRPHLDKREFYPSVADGQNVMMAGKTKALNVEDLKFLVENSEDIINLMEGRLKPEAVKLVGGIGL